MTPFTEGGRPRPDPAQRAAGWADRVAEELATRSADFGYANLAVRGRLLGPIVDEQIDAAVALEPDLVTIYAGGNDFMRPKIDIDALVARYDEALGKLAATGAEVLVWTAYDAGGRQCSAAARPVRDLQRTGPGGGGPARRPDRRTSGASTSTATCGCGTGTRLHMSTPGHQNMAIRVLQTLGVEHHIVMDRSVRSCPPTGRPSARPTAGGGASSSSRGSGADSRGTSSGDGITAKRPTLAPIR